MGCNSILLATWLQEFVAPYRLKNSFCCASCSASGMQFLGLWQIQSPVDHPLRVIDNASLCLGMQMVPAAGNCLNMGWPATLYFDLIRLRQIQCKSNSKLSEDFLTLMFYAYVQLSLHRSALCLRLLLTRRNSSMQLGGGGPSATIHVEHSCLRLQAPVAQVASSASHLPDYCGGVALLTRYFEAHQQMDQSLLFKMEQSCFFDADLPVFNASSRAHWYHNRRLQPLIDHSGTTA